MVEVSAAGSTPPVVQEYALNAIWAPPVQTFPLGTLSPATPVTVSAGVPGEGAGNLETKASADEYTFTVPAGGSRTVIDCLSTDSSYATWTLLNSAGPVVRTDTFLSWAGRRFDQVLPAGVYRWRLVPGNEQTGRYSMRFYLPPAAQTFPVVLSTTTATAVNNGVPAPGAGTLETWLSKDSYTFTATAGQELSLDTRTVAAALRWELRNPSGVVVATNTLVDDQRVPGLVAGKYTFTVFIDPASTATDYTYALNLQLVGG